MKEIKTVTQLTDDKNAKVYIVGAGPGSVDLLTIKALSVIQNCDVILFDNLVSEEICGLFPVGAKRIFVGKRKCDHSISQENLNQLMIKLFRKGQRVCRLKGGDPFVFGRGSEEMLSLVNAGVSVELVPGITAASGCSGYAGIPLTHRGVSQGCTFVTGHGESELSINWASLAKLEHTLVFYMGLSRLNLISEKLIKNGLSRNTPAALIENGSHHNQRVVTTTLSQLHRQALLNEATSPALILVGDVVSFSNQLDWFKPLKETVIQTLSA